MSASVTDMDDRALNAAKAGSDEAAKALARDLARRALRNLIVEDLEGLGIVVAEALAEVAVGPGGEKAVEALVALVKAAAKA